MAKRKLILILLCLSIAIFSCGLIYGMVFVEVTNEFETGIVDIRLIEYQKVGDEEVPWSDNPLILPGATISKIPRIYNDGNDCYVRAKITFRDANGLNDSNLMGISGDWVKADDGYYYYKKILPHGEDVDIFSALKIPNDYSQEHEGKTFYIDIDADAIQSKNFDPEFTLSKPWGNVEILECEKEGMYDVSTFKKSDNKAFSITYHGDTGKLVKNIDDFFQNFPYLMPGDTYSDTLKLVNDGNNDIKLYFRGKATDESELLDKIQLKITTTIKGTTKVVYEGDLRAEPLNVNILLGQIPEGKTGTFDFEIYVPHELNNYYTISSSFVKWIFSTEPIPDSSLEDNPKTGDTSHIEVWMTITVLSLFAVISLLVLYKRESKKNNKGGRRDG